MGAEPCPAGCARNGLVLRRLHDHAGHLGVVGGRGTGDGGAAFRQFCHSDRGGDPDRAVLLAIGRHRARRQAVRPDHGSVFRRAVSARTDPHFRPARSAAGAGSALGSAVCRDGRHARLPGARIGGAGGDGRGGAVRRHGAFRPQADRLCVAVVRLSGADAELFRARRADAGRPVHGRKPVLPDGPRGVAFAARLSCHHGNGDRARLSSPAPIRSCSRPCSLA